jgi:hypothetical protein
MSKRTTKKNIRNLLSMLLTFLLTIGLLLLSLLLVLQFTVLRPAFLLDQVNSSDYSASVKTELERTFVSYGIAGGFDEDFFAGTLVESEMGVDIFMEAARLYDPSRPGADIEKFEENFHAQLIQYVQENGGELTKDTEESIDYLTGLCTEAYKSKVSVPLANALQGIITRLHKVILPAEAACGLLLIISAVLLFLIRERKEKAIPFIAYAFGASGLVLAVLGIAVLASGRIERVGIATEALYKLVTTYLYHTVTPVLGLAGFMIIISAVTALLFYYAKKRKSM